MSLSTLSWNVAVCSVSLEFATFLSSTIIIALAKFCSSPQASGFSTCSAARNFSHAAASSPISCSVTFSSHALTAAAAELSPAAGARCACASASASTANLRLVSMPSMRDVMAISYLRILPVRLSTCHHSRMPVCMRLPGRARAGAMSWNVFTSYLVVPAATSFSRSITPSSTVSGWRRPMYLVMMCFFRAGVA